jgi:hypothetical protein
MAVAPTIDWRRFVVNKWLLWDACAIIKVIKYEAEEIFTELAKLHVTNIYINPVQLELLATVHEKDSIKRSGILAQYFDLFPFGASQLEMAKKVQLATGAISQPSPTDLYLGATLATQNPALTCLITENMKDFPADYFKRECYVTLHDNKTACSLAILTTKEANFS